MDGFLFAAARATGFVLTADNYNRLARNYKKIDNIYFFTF